MIQRVLLTKFDIEREIETWFQILKTDIALKCQHCLKTDAQYFKGTISTFYRMGLIEETEWNELWDKINDLEYGEVI